MFLGDDRNCLSKLSTIESCPNPLFLLAIITSHSAGAHNVFHKKNGLSTRAFIYEKIKKQ